MMVRFSAMNLVLHVATAALLLCCASAERRRRRVTLSNAVPRLDVDGNIIDCHDGNLVGPVNGTYYLYGEWYGQSNFAVAGSESLPKLSVYTSPNLTGGSWTFRGLLHNNTAPGWAASPAWPWAPKGAWYSPSAVYSEARGKFIMYWSASAAECCVASWGVAQSDDGVHFELVAMTAKGHYENSSVDGSSLLIDDDGVGYVAYTAIHGVPGRKDHIVSIDMLNPDLLGSSKTQVAVFPDFFVEGAMLFKRGKTYYVIYGSCCCACRQGSGAVVLSAPNITGPWVRQARDVNCKVDAEICAGMPDQEINHLRPLDQLTISAQGIAISTLRKAGVNGEDVFLWQGMRWLSGAHNPPKCTTLCNPPTGVCAQDPAYRTSADFDYWIPLEFDAQGKVKQFAEFVDEFDLVVAGPHQTGAQEKEEGEEDETNTETETGATAVGYPIFQAHASSHYDMGRQIGAQAAARIHKWIQTYTALNKLLLPFSTTSTGREAISTFRRTVCDPDSTMKPYCDELRGMANGTGVPFETFLVLSVRHELTELMKGNNEADDSVRQDPECTDVLTQTAFGHNEDGSAALLETGYFVNGSVTDADSGSIHTAFFSFFYPASPAGHAFGVNLIPGGGGGEGSRGGGSMAMSMNAVFPKNVDIGGVPVYFLTRAVLDCTSHAEALAVLRETRSAYGGSLNLGTAPNGVINVEFGPSLMEASSPTALPGQVQSTRPPAGGVSFHMNEYLHLKTVPFDKDPSSEHRLKAATGIAAAHPVVATMPASFLRVLGDVSDVDYPLWRNTSGLDDSSTAATVLFEFQAERGDVQSSVSMTVYERGNPLAAETVRRRFVF
jgi:hypothetical protein